MQTNDVKLSMERKMIIVLLLFPYKNKNKFEKSFSSISFFRITRPSSLHHHHTGIHCSNLLLNCSCKYLWLHSIMWYFVSKDVLEPNVRAAVVLSCLMTMFAGLEISRIIWIVSSAWCATRKYPLVMSFMLPKTIGFSAKKIIIQDITVKVGEKKF